MTVTTVCSTCAGARWVCRDDPLRPWHLGGCGGDSGRPCPACNLGPDYYPWHDKCLHCATLEEFMSTLEPDDDDAVLAAMFEQLTDIKEPDAATDYTKLTDVQVSHAFNDVRDRLLHLGEMQEPKTDEGRDLHSKRAALLVVMADRKMR